MNSYGEKRLKNLMRQSDVKIKDIADALGCTDKNVYSRIKHPQNFTVDECIKMANVLSCPVKVVIRCITSI